MIYGDRDPGDLISKMNSRRDKYDISGKVHISVGEKEIYRMMKEYDGVIIWDLPANIFNRYLTPVNQCRQFFFLTSYSPVSIGEF